MAQWVTSLTGTLLGRVAIGSNPDMRWLPAVGGKVCVYGLCIGFGMHTALQTFTHAVSTALTEGFQLCQIYWSKALPIFSSMYVIELVFVFLCVYNCML